MAASTAARSLSGLKEVGYRKIPPEQDFYYIFVMLAHDRQAGPPAKWNKKGRFSEAAFLQRC
jgi:hypothetical protein